MIDLYKRRKKRLAARYREQLASSKQTVSEADIVIALQQEGITQGDVLMVHSSFRQIGYVEHGPKTLIDALLRVVGDKGTLMMPAFPAVGFNDDYLKSKPVFDIQKTPSRMGVVTETFRQMSGVLRSFHPTDSVIARGKDAAFLTKDHFGQLTPYNENSPFFRLCSLHGKILMIGVGLESLTNLHTLEDAVGDFRFPVYHKMTVDAVMIDALGQQHTMRTKVHNPEFSKKRRCNDLMPHFEAAGFLKHFQLGQAACLLIDAGAMHQWMLENYTSRGITMYTPKGY